MTTKQRAYLKSLAMEQNAIFSVGKSAVTPEMVTSISDALEARELIKNSVLNNCAEDPKAIAETLAGRTRSEVVQVIGKKIVLYRANSEKPKILLPKG